MFDWHFPSGNTNIGVNIAFAKTPVSSKMLNACLQISFVHSVCVCVYERERGGEFVGEKERLRRERKDGERDSYFF